MALKTDIRGMVWKYPEPFVVGREQIRQYANSVKAHDPASVDPAVATEMGYSGLVAPLTFVSIIAVMTQRHFFQHVDVGFETMQIVQVDQKFKFLRPIVEGDVVEATMYIDSVDERFGADIVTSRNVLTDAETGEVVMEAFTTLMGHQGEVSISASWDPETGQVLRRPDAHED
jgi:acyl-CoA thioesterase FadM